MSIIIPANSAVGGGFDVDNSLRFNSGSSDYLNRTPGGAGNRQTWTLNIWVKRAKLGVAQAIFTAGSNENNVDNIQFDASDRINFWSYDNNTDYSILTTRVFRDTSAWYNLQFVLDTTNGTANDRVQLYVNGVRETVLTTNTMPSQNYSGLVNTTIAHYVGRYGWNANQYFDGYLSEVVFIDGQALAPTSFGAFDSDSGIWRPIDVSGLTFGTNGFYLDFENSSALGNDAAGSNNFTVNNLTAIDQTTDSCTNNFATLNPLIIKNFLLPNMYYVETRQGNTVLNGTASTNNGNCYSTIGVNSGKWYVEAKKESGTSGYPYIGIMPEEGLTPASSNVYGLVGYNFTDTVSYETSGNKRINGSTSSYGDTYTTGDIIGIALDCDNGAVYFSKSGTFQNSGNPASGASKTGAALTFTPSKYYFFGFSTFGASGQISVNFGNPSYANSSSVADGNDRGAFEYAPPSGYLSLCTKNLSEVNS